MVNQVQGDYLAKDTRMLAYLDEVKNIFRKIKYIKISQILREENKKANALANLASTFDFVSNRSIPLEFLLNPSIEIAKQSIRLKRVQLGWTTLSHISRMECYLYTNSKLTKSNTYL